MSYSNRVFSPPLGDLGVLAVQLPPPWRLNFPAFTHDDDGIEHPTTVYRRLGSDMDPAHPHGQVE
ncbi:MAG TPA: hypothetical protein DEW46_00580, partial [Verrucomicrobia bacterium]|nr:hypothetical protein [Verrucomicrobiota bacterium]